MDTHDVDGGPFVTKASLLCGEAIAGECVVGGRTAVHAAVSASVESIDVGTLWVDHVTPLNAANMNKVETQ